MADENLGPGLSAIEPFLAEREAAAKELAEVRVAGKSYPPAAVYFCSDSDSFTCPGVVADDTIHLYEKMQTPQSQFALDSGASLRLSSELDARATAYIGDTSLLHASGYGALNPLKVSPSGDVDFRQAKGKGRQVFLVFAQTPDHKRHLKFVWLVD
jgi:hypothetical protein